ncbi:MAG: Crp/Fnr family transcriptional regulator [Planctomycetaceae bacterium]|nr:Crp/Fnr family transcriptional regulator [Planctomycetaceae bacterium]
MSESVSLETLKTIPFLDNIPDKHLERLAKIAKKTEFPAGTNIFQEYDIANNAYLILSGRVSLVTCLPDVGCRELMQVSDGEFIGWSPLIDQHHMTDTAHTKTTTVALMFRADELLDLCREELEFGFEFMHRVAMVLTQRLRATRLVLMTKIGQQFPGVQLESD